MLQKLTKIDDKESIKVELCKQFVKQLRKKKKMRKQKGKELSIIKLTKQLQKRMPETSHQYKPRLKNYHEENATAKSSIFERHDNYFPEDNEKKQKKNQHLHPLSGSNFSLPANHKQGNKDRSSQNHINSTKQMFSSSMFGMEHKGSAGSLFQMARHVHDPVDEDQFLKAEKQRNKYSFLQVPRPNVVNGLQGGNNDLKMMGASSIYQRKQSKAPSFLKKDTKSSIDPNQNALETPFKKPQNNKLNVSTKVQYDAKSQVDSKKSKKIQFNTPENCSPMLMKKNIDSGSPVNSSDSKNISTNEPKQSTLNNTLLDPKTIQRKNWRKGSMMILNQKEFYTPTEKNSAKLGSSDFIEISEKYNTVKNQNKSQFLMIYQKQKNMSSLSPKVNDKKQKVLIPSFIKFKDKRNEVFKRQEEYNPYPVINTTTSLDFCEAKICLQDFEIKQRLGKGAFGDVYLARQKNIGFFCVLKKLSKKKIKQQNTQQLILREIKIQSFLTHRHITNLYGFFDDEEYIYLIMEYMSDGSVAQRFGRKKVSQKQVAMIVKQICDALKFMHIENIIHRDIKPDNVFIHQDYIKLGDFGCSVFSDSKRNTMVGSLAYFSPEQLNNESYDEKIDVWSVGILCYEMLTGRSPFEEDILKFARQQKQAKLSQLRFPTKLQLSQEAKDFTRRLLQEIPENRLSITETLKHPFIVKNNIVENLISSSELNIR